MLSQKTRYALRAMLALAARWGEPPMMIADIADEQSIPKKFLEIILLDLKNRGLVHSRRGREGGYRLSKAPDEISFAQIIRIIDGPLAPVPCVSQTAYRLCEDCPNEETCAIRRVMFQVREATVRVLESTTLADALPHSRKGALAGVA